MPLYGGREQQAECMRSGKKCQASELVRDGRNPQLLVLPEWADDRHPQESPFIPDDVEGIAHWPLGPQNLPNPALTLGGVFSGTLTMNWTVAQLIGPRAETYKLYKTTNGSDYSVLYTYNVDYTNGTGHVANIGLQKDYGHIYYVQQSQNDPNSGVILPSDPSFASVVLLAHCDGTNGAQMFVDSSTYNHAPTLVFSGPINNTATKKFGTASALCGVTVGAGNGVIKYAPTAAEFNLSGDFTIEGWVYMPSAILGTNGPFLVLKTVTNTTIASLTLNASGGNFRIGFAAVSLNAGTINPSAATDIAPDTQHAFSLVQSGKTVSLYINGVLSTTDTFASTPVYATVDRVELGGDNAGSSFYQGYLDEVRFTNGVARYTGNYTPAVAAFADLGAFDQYFSNVSWLTHLDGSLTDSSTYSRDPTLTGNPALTGADFKFGTGSLAFTGGLYNVISAPITAGGALDLSTGDFTVEFWFKRTTTAGQDVLAYTGSISGRNGFYINITNAQIGAFFDDGGGGYLGQVGPLATSMNVWNHLVLQRRGTTHDLYMNGVRGTPANIVAANPAGDQFRFGGAVAGFGAINSLNGWMDEIRVTKGVARYAGSFPPPTAPFSTTTVPAAVYTYYIAAIDSLGDAVATSNVLTLTVTGTGVIS